MTALYVFPDYPLGRIQLDIASAPGQPANKYASNFTAGVDGWTGGGAGVTVATDTTMDPDALRLSGGPNNEVTADRVVSGLTIGATYRFRAYVQRYGGKFALRIVGGVSGAFTMPPQFARTPVELSFTATATSHTLRMVGDWDSAGGSPQSFMDTVTLFPTDAWQGTSVTRTDANGTDVPVREGTGDLDIPAGSTTLSFYDFEAALAGDVTYTVHDGTGGTATAVATFDATGVLPWLTAPATANQVTGLDPSAVGIELVTGYSESVDSAGTLHAIIGRADRIATPGPLGLRRGTVDLFCSDYAGVVAVRALAASGEILFLRQPTFAGMDLYFYPQSIAARPEPENTQTRRWIVSLTYEQVLAT